MSFGGDEVRDLVKCLYRAVDGRDWATVEELVSERIVVEVAGGGPMNWEQWRAHLEEFVTAFPDGKHIVEDVLVDGSHGVTRCRFTGTHTGEFRGVAPTGAKVSVAGINIDRFQGDLLVEHRGQLDLYGLLQQLGNAAASN
jgi:predicted ester cyclase